MVLTKDNKNTMATIKHTRKLSLLKISQKNLCQTMTIKIDATTIFIPHRQKNYDVLSFQKTAFYNGECRCSRQQPK